MNNRKPRKDGSYVVPVSFRSDETSLLAYADTKGNFSQYIKRLIYEDMNKKPMSQEPQMTELMMQMLIKQFLNGDMNLKDVIQKSGANAEISTDVVEEKEKPKEKKADKNAILNIMGTGKKK